MINNYIYILESKKIKKIVITNCEWLVLWNDKTEYH